MMKGREIKEDCKEDIWDGQNLYASFRAKRCTDSIEWQREREEAQEGAQIAEQYIRPLFGEC